MGNTSRWGSFHLCSTPNTASRSKYSERCHSLLRSFKGSKSLHIARLVLQVWRMVTEISQNHTRTANGPFFACRFTFLWLAPRSMTSIGHAYHWSPSHQASNIIFPDMISRKGKQAKYRRPTRDRVAVVPSFSLCLIPFLVGPPSVMLIIDHQAIRPLISFFRIW